MKNKTFLEQKQQSIEDGFWEENHKGVIYSQLELNYKTEIIREWGICGLTTTGDKILVKWYKRFRPLDDEELKSKYGR